MAHSSFIAPASSRVCFARFPRIAGETQLLLVSDCLQLAVIPNQLSLDGSFSSEVAAKL